LVDKIHSYEGNQANNKKKSTTRGKKQALLFLEHGVCPVVAKEPPTTDSLCGGAEK
jgi:hypothetical protein